MVTLPIFRVSTPFFFLADLLDRIQRPALCFFEALLVERFDNEARLVVVAEAVENQPLRKPPELLLDWNAVQIKLTEIFVELCVALGRLLPAGSWLQLVALMVEDDQITVVGLADHVDYANKLSAAKREIVPFLYREWLPPFEISVDLRQILRAPIEILFENLVVRSFSFDRLTEILKILYDQIIGLCPILQMLSDQLMHK